MKCWVGEMKALSLVVFLTVTILVDVNCAQIEPPALANNEVMNSIQDTAGVGDTQDEPQNEDLDNQENDVESVDQVSQTTEVENKPDSPTVVPNSPLPNTISRLTMRKLVSQLREVFMSLSLTKLQELKESIGEKSSEKDAFEAFEGFLEGIYGGDVDVLQVLDDLNGHFRIVSGLLNGAIVTKQEVLKTESDQGLEKNAISQLISALKSAHPDNLNRLRQSLNTGDFDPQAITVLLKALQGGRATGLNDWLISFAVEHPNLLTEAVKIIPNQATTSAPYWKSSPEPGAVDNILTEGEWPSDYENQADVSKPAKALASTSAPYWRSSPEPGDVDAAEGEWASDYENQAGNKHKPAPEYEPFDASEQVDGMDVWGDDDDYYFNPVKYVWTDPPRTTENKNWDNEDYWRHEEYEDIYATPIHTNTLWPRYRVSSSRIGMWIFLIVFLLTAVIVVTGYLCYHYRKKIQESVGSCISDSRVKRTRTYRYQLLNT